MFMLESSAMMEPSKSFNDYFSDGVGYIALGLSSTPSMGDASVMECVQENGEVREYNSWNFPRSNTRNEVVSLNPNYQKKKSNFLEHRNHFLSAT